MKLTQDHVRHLFGKKNRVQVTDKRFIQKFNVPSANCVGDVNLKRVVDDLVNEAYNQGYEDGREEVIVPIRNALGISDSREF
jgi:hypothetical protein